VRARQAEQDFGQIHRHRASLGEKEFVVDPQGQTKEKIYVCEALAITSSPSRTVAHATPTPSGGASTGSQRRLATGRRPAIRRHRELHAQDRSA
jgi:hypothetical protein